MFAVASPSHSVRSIRAQPPSGGACVRGGLTHARLITCNQRQSKDARSSTPSGRPVGRRGLRWRLWRVVPLVAAPSTCSAAGEHVPVVDVHKGIKVERLTSRGARPLGESPAHQAR